jgi:hypothetical protein
MLRTFRVVVGRDGKDEQASEGEVGECGVKAGRNICGVQNALVHAKQRDQTHPMHSKPSSKTRSYFVKYLRECSRHLILIQNRFEMTPKDRGLVAVSTRHQPSRRILNTRSDNRRKWNHRPSLRNIRPTNRLPRPLHRASRRSNHHHRIRPISPAPPRQP